MLLAACARPAGLLLPYIFGSRRGRTGEHLLDSLGLDSASLVPRRSKQLLPNEPELPRIWRLLRAGVLVWAQHLGTVGLQEALRRLLNNNAMLDRQLSGIFSPRTSIVNTDCLVLLLQGRVMGLDMQQVVALEGARRAAGMQRAVQPGGCRQCSG